MSTPHAGTLALPPQPTDHVLGPEHARVTVVEYGDFECPSCKVAATTPTLLIRFASAGDAPPVLIAIVRSPRFTCRRPSPVVFKARRKVFSNLRTI